MHSLFITDKWISQVEGKIHTNIFKNIYIKNQKIFSREKKIHVYHKNKYNSLVCRIILAHCNKSTASQNDISYLSKQKRNYKTSNSKHHLKHAMILKVMPMQPERDKRIPFQMF
jgi:hypothetical protein